MDEIELTQLSKLPLSKVLPQGDFLREKLHLLFARGQASKLDAIWNDDSVLDEVKEWIAMESFHLAYRPKVGDKTLIPFTILVGLEKKTGLTGLADTTIISRVIARAFGLSDIRIDPTFFDPLRQEWIRQQAVYDYLSREMTFPPTQSGNDEFPIVAINCFTITDNPEKIEKRLFCSEQIPQAICQKLNRILSRQLGIDVTFFPSLVEFHVVPTCAYIGHNSTRTLIAIEQALKAGGEKNLLGSPIHLHIRTSPGGYIFSVVAATPTSHHSIRPTILSEVELVMPNWIDHGSILNSLGGLFLETFPESETIGHAPNCKCDVKQFYRNMGHVEVQKPKGSQLGH